MQGGSWGLLVLFGIFRPRKCTFLEALTFELPEPGLGLCVLAGALFGCRQLSMQCPLLSAPPLQRCVSATHKEECRSELCCCRHCRPALLQDMKTCWKSPDFTDLFDTVTLGGYFPTISYAFEGGANFESGGFSGATEKRSLRHRAGCIALCVCKYVYRGLGWGVSGCLAAWLLCAGPCTASL